MKDKYGYDIPDKANIMYIRPGKNTNPDQDKILETANILIDKAMEAFPTEQPQIVNTLGTALEYYFVREMQNQIERHERGELPKYMTICATIMHASKLLSDMSIVLKSQLEEIMNYVSDKPKLTDQEMQVMMKDIVKFYSDRDKQSL